MTLFNKIIFLILLSVFLFIVVVVFGQNNNSNNKKYTACYVCEDGRMIKYYGEDSYILRKRIKEFYECVIIDRVWSCNTNQPIKEEK